MLDFLNFPYSEEAVAKRLQTPFNDFHRQRHADFEHYTPQQRAKVEEILRNTIELLREWNHGETYGVEKYLH